MAEVSASYSGTYRCPVCGHRDRAELPPASYGRVITCSYCSTTLELSSRGSGSLRFSVQVSGEATATK